MNNNAPALLRSLIIYVVCVMLAIYLGYLLSEIQTWTYWTYGMVAAGFLVLCAPILLKWHHLLLVASWNLTLMIYFVHGSPFIWMPMVLVSLGISILQRTLNSKEHFLSAPAITSSLIFFTAVIFFTARLTGGIGLHTLGSEISGGKSYMLLFFAILGYFALTAKRIPPERAKLCVTLFLIGGCVAAIGDLAPYVPSSLYFLFAFFPVSGYDLDWGANTMNFHARFAGTGQAGLALSLLMLAQYGVRGIFTPDKLWRLAFFALFCAMMMLGGFRSFVILCGLIFAVQFFLERVYQTRVFPVFIFCGIIIAVLLVPFAQKLPYTFQRSLAFLPLKINEAAHRDAENTLEWRLQIWKDMLPTVPKYLLLGKGYSLSRLDLETASSHSFKYVSDADQVAIVGNYHSGPLSVVIPLGIWGIIGVLWFWIASLHALYRNYRYGDPALRTVNIFLFAYFIAKIILFIVVFGGLYSDMSIFVGIIGLNISLNGGVRRRIPQAAQSMKGMQSVRRLQHSFQR